MSNNASATANVPPSAAKPKCGIIMPISALDGLSEAHWLEVNDILSDAISTAGFEPNLVSTAEEVGIIQKTIIQNLYDNPVVVCDVSGKNPNVMFELGMRLAFDRPTIIVKDDKTSYTFDTSSIEHLGYPRDLRFNQIVEFKNKLTEKVKNTHKKAASDPNYTTFLKHFGEFKVAKIDQTEVSGQEFIIDELKSLKQSISRLEHSTRKPRARFPIERHAPPTLEVNLDKLPPTERLRLLFLMEKEFPEPAIEVFDDRLRIFVPDDWSIAQHARLQNAISHHLQSVGNSQESREDETSSSRLEK